jgi:predicted nucleic acid-binding protein
MIALNTHVVSGAMRPHPAPTVRVWLNAQVAKTLYLPSATLALERLLRGRLP